MLISFQQIVCLFVRVCPRYCGCLLFQTTAPAPRPSLSRSHTITGKVCAPLHKHWWPKRENSNTFHNTVQLMPAIITVGGDRCRGDARCIILMVCPDKALFSLQNPLVSWERMGRNSQCVEYHPVIKTFQKWQILTQDNDNFKLFCLLFFRLFVKSTFWFSTDETHKKESDDR